MVESSKSARKDSLDEDAASKLGYSLDFKVKLPSGEEVCVVGESQICFQQQNPKRPSSIAYEFYERYKSATTILEFAVLQGAARSKKQVGTDLKYDIQKGYAELLDWKASSDAPEKPKKEKSEVRIEETKKDNATHSHKVKKESLKKTNSKQASDVKKDEVEREEAGKDQVNKDNLKKANSKQARDVKKEELKKDEEEKDQVKESEATEMRKRQMPKSSGADLKRTKIQKQLLKVLSPSTAKNAKQFLYRQKRESDKKPPALIARELAERKKMESLQEALTKMDRNDGKKQEQNEPMKLAEAIVASASRKRARTDNAGFGEVSSVAASAAALPVPNVAKDLVKTEEKLASNGLMPFGNNSGQQALFRELLGDEGAAIFMAFAAALGVVAPEGDERADLSQEEQALRGWEVKLRGVIALSETAADRVCNEVLSRARKGVPFAPNLPVMTFEEARAVLLRCGGKEALNRERARRVASSAPKG